MFEGHERLDKILSVVDEGSIGIEELVETLLKQYCSSLEDLMLDWKKIMEDKKNPPTEYEIMDIVLELPVILHYVAEGVEKLGIKEDVSTIIRNELYNRTLLNASGKVDDKRSTAELAIVEESIIQCAYKRSSKLIKSKLESGYELLNSAKKVLGYMQAKMELTKVENGKISRNSRKDD